MPEKLHSFPPLVICRFINQYSIRECIKILHIPILTVKSLCTPFCVVGNLKFNIASHHLSAESPTLHRVIYSQRILAGRQYGTLREDTAHASQRNLIRINDILSLRPLRARPYYSDKLPSNSGSTARYCLQK